MSRQEKIFSSTIHALAVWAAILAALSLPAAVAESGEPNSNLIRRIQEVGEVELVYESSRNETRKGLTEFYLKWSDYYYTYTYTYEVLDGKTIVAVDVEVDIDAWTNHTIRMPDAERDADWYKSLLYHEYDHVAISIDERPIELFLYLAEELHFSGIPIRSEEDITSDFVKGLIEKRLDEYGSEVQRVIQANYDLMDQVSDHGLKPIPARYRFFENLYTHKNLETADFAYLDDTAEYIRSPQYRRALTYYF